MSLQYYLCLTYIFIVKNGKHVWINEMYGFEKWHYMLKFYIFYYQTGMLVTHSDNKKTQ